MKKQEDLSQPVAYDTNGRPLYAHPAKPQEDPTSAPQVVHLSRAVEPEKQVIGPETKRKHQESVRLHPHLNLSDGEFVISAVRRHVIGLLIPASITVMLIVMMLGLVGAYPAFAEWASIQNPGARLPAIGDIMLTGMLFVALFAIGGYIAIWVYINNKFFLTNESVIQEIQVSLFRKQEQTVSLGNIEDASFTQKGIIQSLFNYGSIRLSTQGDETTYRFQYVANPKYQIALLNDAVEAFKNGRPVEN